MNEEKYTKVRFSDEDHLWINGSQYVSLRRFLEAKKDVINELKNELNIMAKECKELTTENEALKVLLKNQLNNKD